MSTDVNTVAPKRRGLLFKLIVGFVVVVVGFIAWLFFERIRGQVALRKYEKQLTAKGEKLKFTEVTPPVPSGQNKAVELGNLYFRTGTALIEHVPPPIRCIAPGKAWVITRDAGWVEKGRTFTWEQVGQDLELNSEALEELRQAVRSPVLRYPLQYQGPGTLLPHLARMRGAAQWLTASAIYKTRRGDIKGAVDDIESALLVARLAEHEAILVSQAARNGVIGIAVSDCWPLLQADNLAEAELARLQAIFERVDPIGPMVLGLQGERAIGRDTFAMIRAGQINVNDLVAIAEVSGGDGDAPQALEKLPFGAEIIDALRLHVIYPTWRFAFSHGDEKRLLEEMQTVIDGTRAGHAAKSAAPLRAIDQRWTENMRPGGEFRSWRYFATSLVLPGNSKGASRAFRVKTQCNIGVAAIALKRYHLRHKKYPTNLDELVPEFVSEVPIDYIDGKPLRYRLDGDQFVLWSIGRDGKDDGGAPNSKPSFGWLEGPDDVWPQAASPAEVAKHREEQLKAP